MTILSNLAGGRNSQSARVLQERDVGSVRKGPGALPLRNIVKWFSGPTHTSRQNSGNPRSTSQQSFLPVLTIAGSLNMMLLPESTSSSMVTSPLLTPINLSTLPTATSMLKAQHTKMTSPLETDPKREATIREGLHQFVASLTQKSGAPTILVDSDTSAGAAEVITHDTTVLLRPNKQVRIGGEGKHLDGTQP